MTDANRFGHNDNLKSSIMCWNAEFRKDGNRTGLAGVDFESIRLLMSHQTIGKAFTFYLKMNGRQYGELGEHHPRLGPRVDCASGSECKESWVT